VVQVKHSPSGVIPEFGTKKIRILWKIKPNDVFQIAVEIYFLTLLALALSQLGFSSALPSIGTEAA